MGMEGRKNVQSMAAQRIVVVKKTCRCMLNASWEKKYCSTTYPTRGYMSELLVTYERPERTSRQTNSSNGSVVNMFRPKQNRATLIRVSFWDHERRLDEREKTDRCKIIEDIPLRSVSDGIKPQKLIVPGFYR